MPSTRYFSRLADGSCEPIQLGAQLDKGGYSGSIYTNPVDPHCAYKLFHGPADKATQAKLEAMLDRPPDLPAQRAGSHSHVQLAWPTGLVLDRDGEVRGFSMPLIDVRLAVPLHHLQQRVTRERFGLRHEMYFRLTAAANLAALIAELHRLDHHVIDLKPLNAQVYRDNMLIALLDCDGFSIAGGKERFPAEQFSSEYICPEALERGLSPRELGESQDRFALAVIVFRLLNNGLHPFTGRPRQCGEVPGTLDDRVRAGLYAYGRAESRLQAPSPGSLHESFPRALRRLFDRAFEAPRSRPSAEDWKLQLRNLIDLDSGALAPCPRERSHLLFTETYCGTCAAAGVSPPPRHPNHRGRVLDGLELRRSIQRIQHLLPALVSWTRERALALTGAIAVNRRAPGTPRRRLAAIGLAAAMTSAAGSLTAAVLLAGLEDTLDRAFAWLGATQEVVQPGDTLLRVARDTYGSGADYALLYWANADRLSNADDLTVGQPLRIPPGWLEPARHVLPTPPQRPGEANSSAGER